MKKLTRLSVLLALFLTNTFAFQNCSKYSSNIAKNGSFSNSSLTTSPVAKTCTVGSVVLSDQETKVFYGSDSALNCDLIKEARSCQNGIISGNPSYYYPLCKSTDPEVKEKKSCVVGSVTLKDGESKLFYGAVTSNSCDSIKENRSCNDGFLSGNATYTYTACSGEGPPPPPPPSNGNVKITEPNKPPYYFSDGHPASYYDGNRNLPSIITNKHDYDKVNDIVWLTNDKIKIGINLKRGGQIAWASLIDGDENLVYNGYDGGFQVTLDAYQKVDGYTQDGEVSGSGFGQNFSYNVTHGGDFKNNAATLIDYKQIPNGYYTKLRPIHYPLTAKMSETFIESTYVLEGRSLKITYKYTSFRTDGQYEGGGFDGGGVPACFIVNKLTHYKTYTGSSPWSKSSVEEGRLPITNQPYNQTVKGTDSTEHWGMVYDPNRPNSGIGVFNNIDGGNSTYFHFKQLEVYPGNAPGDEFKGGFTFFQANSSFGTKEPGDIFKKIQNRNNYSREMTVYLMVGSEQEIRAEAYKHAGK